MYVILATFVQPGAQQVVEGRLGKDLLDRGLEFVFQSDELDLFNGTAQGER